MCSSRRCGSRALDRGSFAAPGLGSRPRDDRHLVEHDGDVLHEDRIGKARFLYEVLNPAAEVLEHPFVGIVLGRGSLEVYRFALNMGQLATSDRRADASG